MRRRARVFYSGRVQGVGFRYGARAAACGFEVTGFVRNLPDGRVELVAEGEEVEVQAFLAAIHDTQLGNYIRKENINWEPGNGEFTGFEIRH
jgi:acylphosphatase